MTISCSRVFPGSGVFESWLHHSDRSIIELPDEDSASRTFILLELVGAIGLDTRTRTDIDPYCVVKVQQKEVHRTKAIKDDGSPIWTVKTKSLCIFEIPKDASKEQRTKTGVTIDVCHRSKRLGTVTLGFEEILKGKGDRREYVIQPTAGSKIKRATLALRFRRASPDDMNFMGKNKEAESLESTDQPELASDLDFQKVNRSKLFQQNYKVGKDKVKRFRIKPYPDPDRPQETEFMSAQQIHKEALKPSTKWVSAGYGSLGTIYLEVIGAKKLPNLDLGVNDLTDPFVAIVFEDNMVRTDVIWDELNPRWMPWTTRAFAFRVRHPTSILMLGAFDYDDSALDYCDPVGRVVINTVNFQSNTTYLLHYKLHHDPRKEMEDESRGTIIIRLRIEWADESEAMRMAFVSPPRFIINVHTDKSYQVLRYLTRGHVDMDESSLDAVKLYLNELLSYWSDYCYFLDVVVETILWRGRLHFGKDRSIWFPVRSVALFAAVVLAIEHPHKIVPILLFGIAWIMLTINFHASRHPYPWKRVKSCEQTNMVVLFGRSIHMPVKIVPGQGVEDGEKLEKLDKLKADRMSLLLKELMNFALKVYRIYSKTSESSVILTTQTKNWSLFRGQLQYVHVLLKSICKFIRLFRNLINWKGYYSNNFTMNCILVATIWIIFPVNTLVLWLARVLAWTLLGPWMKFVDIFWVHSWYKTKDELLDQIEGAVETKPSVPDFDALIESDVLSKMGHSGRIVAENGVKLKDMREHVYGHYSERIPVVNATNASIPLPESLAYPTREKPNKVERYHVPGQRLTDGHMIPPRDSGGFALIKDDD